MRLPSGRKFLLLAAAAIGAVPASHLLKLHAIECECSAYRRHATNALSPELAVRQTLCELNRRNYKNFADPGGYDFILGDFDEVGGKVRCGGAARIFAEMLAQSGFETKI